jgi:hypothetical protein
MLVLPMVSREVRKRFARLPTLRTDCGRRGAACVQAREITWCCRHGTRNRTGHALPLR